MVITVEALDIPEVKLIRPTKIEDARGFFSEVYSKRAFAEAGIDIDFVQDNHSYSERAGVLRGLHFQTPPSAQTKLARVVSGRIWAVAVDLRVGSPSYRRWVGEELSAENWTQLLIPQGFAHGFVALEPDTEVLYKVDAFYDRETAGELSWDDPELAIDWPLEGEPQLSDKDSSARCLADWVPPFIYNEQDQ